MPLPSGKLKIGLLGVEDPADVRSYSGYSVFICGIF